MKEIEQLQVTMKKNSKKSKSMQQHIDQIQFEHQQSFKKVNDFKGKIQEVSNNFYFSIYLILFDSFERSRVFLITFYYSR